MGSLFGEQRRWVSVAIVAVTLGLLVLTLINRQAGASPTSLADLAPMEIEVAFPSLTFSQPVHLTHADDGTNRIFVVEQAGRIIVFENEPETTASNVFMDIQDSVNSGGFEEGLLGLAFDPNYSTNSRFYVYYTSLNDSQRVSRVSRFTVTPTNPNLANVNSEVVVLEVDQPAANHNGGTIAFGPDGYLYIGLGDGGFANDPQGHGQDKTTLLGSLLRIDVSTLDATGTYAIPPDNPFVGATDGSRGEIWAYGLRNPWKFSFDSLYGDLWAADVGQNQYEEIELIQRGGNYGWNVMEGLHCFSPSSGCDQTGLQLPVFEYEHSEGCSITGGHIYRGRTNPGLYEAYVYADYCSGRIWALRYQGNNVVDQALLVDTSLTIPSLGVDEHDSLYILAFDGKIYRLVEPPLPDVPGLTQWGFILLAGLLILAAAWSATRRYRSAA